jgi:hypothetical protein
MLLEIVLMARLTPFAGGSVAAAGVVVAVMLMAAGAGARVSERIPATRPNLVRITTAAALGAALLGLVTGWLPVGWEATLPWRVSACALLIAPVAFILGMAFPVGLRHLAVQAPAQIPWAWAINSCVSVIAPSAAVLISVGAGYPWVFASAAALYAAAAAFSRQATPKSPSTSARDGIQSAAQ